jgi:two-component system, cell cycle sensor histidine kinase and response regulator CckA
VSTATKSPRRSRAPPPPPAPAPPRALPRAASPPVAVAAPPASPRGDLPAPPSPTLLARAFRTLPEGVFIADARWRHDGLRILFCNTRFGTMIGHPAREVVGRHHAFFHADRSELARQRRWFRGVAPGRVYAAEGYLTRRDGSSLFAAWLLSPICDARGRVTHVVATYRDVTEKRRLQEALIHAQRIDAVGRLAGGVAHDFNNLLSVINGYSEILSDRLADDDRARHELAEIHEAGQKAAALTRQLLAFSRRQSMDPKVVQLNDVVRGHADLLERLLRPDKHLHLALSPDVGNVRIDPAALQQVLLNLTLNARDALTPGGHVTLATSRREIRPGATNRRLTDTPPGRYIQLSVSDSGSGMDEHVQAHLFEPFFTTKPQGQGTGLGLALVYGVIQQSGGFIFVHSAPGVGTTFDILLPEVNEPAAASGASLPPLPSTKGRETTLIVEADPVLRKMIAGILTADGYVVHSAATPAEGLGEARKAAQPVQLVIVDRGRIRGDEDGDRLVRALYLNRQDLRVLATSSREEAPGIPWMAPEAQAHLIKPFTLSTLLKVIRTLLDSAAKPGTTSV